MADLATRPVLDVVEQKEEEQEQEDARPSSTGSPATAVGSVPAGASSDAPTSDEEDARPLDPGFMLPFDSQRYVDFAALLLALDNHFNVGSLMTTIARAMMFATDHAKRLVIEVDALMTNPLPEDAVFTATKPTIPTSPESNKACERMFVADTTYLATGGQLATADAKASCFGTVYPVYMVTSTHGTSKKEDKAFTQDLRRAQKIDQELGVVGKLLDSLSPEQTEERNPILDRARKLKEEKKEIDKRCNQMMQKRADHIQDKRDSLSFISNFSLPDNRKWKITEDPVFQNRDHVLAVYGLLGAALDDNQIALTLYYHSDIAFNIEEHPLDPIEFFMLWQTQRRKTIDTIASGKLPFEKIPRHTTIVHFWFPKMLIAEFVWKIFQNRAIFMQNRISERYKNPDEEAVAVKPTSVNEKK